MNSHKESKERGGCLQKSKEAEPPNSFKKGNMSAQPPNEQEDEDHQTKKVMPKEFQGDSIRGIRSRLCNIAIQVQDLNICADDFVAELSKEFDSTSSTLRDLCKSLAQLMGVTYKEPHLEATESKDASESTLPKEQAYTSQAVPVKMYKLPDACGENLPLSIPTCYWQDDTDLKNLSDNSYSFGICKVDVMPESKEQSQDILKGQKCLYHPNEPKSVPLGQSVQNDASVNYTQADCRDISHSSLVNQPVESFSFASPLFTEISEILMRGAGKVVARPLNSSRSRGEEQEDTLKFIHYGVGKGEKLQPQPPIQHKTEVFVSPTAPAPPPLPSDWLALLEEPKRPSAPTTLPSPSQSPASLLRTPAASHPQCLQRTPEAGDPVTPPKVDLLSPLTKLVQHCEMVPHDLLPPDEETNLSPPKTPPSVVSYRIETKERVTDQVGHASHVQSAAFLGFPSEGSSFTQSPRHCVTKLPRSSNLPTPKSFNLAPSRYPISASKPSAAPLSGHSTLRSSQSSAPLSSSGQQAPRSLTQSVKHVSAQSARRPVVQSRSAGAQFARSSVAAAERSSGAQSTRHLVSPQQRPSSLKSTQTFTFKSLFSSAPPPSSCVLHPRTPSVTQSSQALVSSGIKLSLSIPPIFSKARSALVEAIRKVILTPKADDQCVQNAKMHIAKMKQFPS